MTWRSSRRPAWTSWQAAGTLRIRRFLKCWRDLSLTPDAEFMMGVVEENSGRYESAAPRDRNMIEASAAKRTTTGQLGVFAG
jgi:hypothetical protein